MKHLSLISLIAVLGSSAFAYRDGSYSCRNIQNLPNNTYKITSLTIPGSSVTAPHVQVNRYYKSSENSEVQHVEFSGFANVMKTNGGETLFLGGMELNFQNGDMANCQRN